jgi:hypothetical protein
MATFHMCTPDNYLDIIQGKGESPDVWLDAALKDEIKRSRRREADTGVACERSAERLAEECEKLFPMGRVFCCKKQLIAMVKAFAVPWALLITTSGKSLKRWYGPPEKRYASRKSKVCPTKRRKTKESLKQWISRRENTVYILYT